MKKSKLLKSLGFTSLAVFMAATGVFAFASLNNAPILPNLSAQASAESQNFDLGLRPDTDPVVYVTESGLEIKKSNAKYTSTTTTTTNLGYTYTQDLTSFYYFTMGTYSGTIYTAKSKTDNYTVTNEPVNWLIIGRGDFDFYDETAAGNSIKKDSSKQEFAAMNNLYLPLAMQSITQHDEIPDDCFLVISEKLLGFMYFNATGDISNAAWWTTNTSFYSYLFHSPTRYGNRYRFFGSTDTTTEGGQSWNTTSNAGGSLYNYINNLFSKNNSTGAITGNNNLGFTQAQADIVVPQQLYTYYSNGSNLAYGETPSTDGNTYYSMFPLAYRAAHSSTFQNFCVEDYLPNADQRVATFIGSNQSYFWWLRSAGTYEGTYTRSASHVLANGTLTANVVDGYYGVRPAFVLKVMG